MKKIVFFLFTGAALLSAASAQEPRVRSPRTGYTITTGPAAARPAWLDKEIGLNIRSRSAGDAVKEILKAVGKSVEKVEITEGLSDERLSLQIRKTKVGDALAAVGRLVGGVAYVSEADEKVSVSLRKREDVSWGATRLLIPGDPTTPDISRRVQDAFNQARGDAARAVRSGSAVVSGFGRTLPDKKVGLDVRNKDVRDILKGLLKDAELDFILEEDVPEDKLHSFTFSPIPIATALDVVCKSVEIGWRAERKDGKTLVRIGKKYAGGRVLLSPFGGVSSPEGVERAITDLLSNAARADGGSR